MSAVSHDLDAVWRVCRVIKGDCKRCPSSELVHGEECVRGCFHHAVECINTVETGNPWRKTEGVKPPWNTRSATPVEGELVEALAEAERFLDYFANGRLCFEGPGTPQGALATVRAALSQARPQSSEADR